MKMSHPAELPQPVARRTADALPADLFDRLRSTETKTLPARIKLEQLILAMQPEEARKRMTSVKGAGEEWLRELLFFRAAEGDPLAVMKEAWDRGLSQPDSFRGLFRAWVRTDPLSALTNAEVAGGNYLPACVRAWAELDPEACARALPGRNLLRDAVWQLTDAWVSRDPEAALDWVENMTDGKWEVFAKIFPDNEGYIRPDQTADEKAAACRDSAMNDFFPNWVRADPVAGFRAAVATEWGRPRSLDVPDPSASWNRPDDWIANAFSTFAKLSPELAARAAAALPQERLTESIASFLAKPLEEAAPGAGVLFARALPTGPLRDAALNTCAFSAAMRGDYVQAKELVASVDDPTKRAVAAGGVLNAWTPVDPYGAREWLPGLARMLPPDLARFAADAFIKEVRKFGPALANPD
jgi:hypothetical protein